VQPARRDPVSIRMARLCPLACVVLAAACGASGSSTPTAASAPKTKAQRCRDIADDMTRTAGMAAGLLVAGLDGEPMSQSDKAGLKAELAVAADELVTRCLDWDEEVFKCFSLFGGGSEKCERIVAVAMGDAVPPLDPPAGPKAAWTFELPSVPKVLAMTEAGLAIALLDDSVTAIGAEGIAWRLDVEGPQSLVLPPAASKEPIVVLHSGGVLGVDVDGTVVFRSTLPLHEDDSPTPTTVARAGNAWLLGDTAARFLRLTPSACAPQGSAKPKAACMTVLGGLPDEYLDSDATLIPLPDGTTLLWEDENLRHLDAAYHVLFDARGLDALDGVLPRADGTVVAFFDNDLVRLDLAQCRSAAPFAPSSYPQANRMYFSGSTECDDCQAPPPGCVVRRDYIKDGDGDQPAVTANGTIVVHTSDATLGMVDGKRAWGHVLAAAGDPVAVQRDVLVIGDTTYGDDGEVALWRLHEDGTVVWRALPTVPAGGDLYWSDDGRLAASGKWAAVSVRRALSVYPL